VVTPVTEDLPQLEDFLDKLRKTMKLAQAADILATFMQARADEKAKNMVINLDSKVDSAVIQAMTRRFPGTDPTRITYQQYRDCKDKMREAGQQIARKANVTPDQINNLREDAVNMLGGGTVRDSGVNTGSDSTDSTSAGGSTTGSSSTTGTDSSGTGTDSGINGITRAAGRRAGEQQSGSGTAKGTGYGLTIGGFDTEAAKTGGLRPELDTNMQIIEPLDLAEMQFSLICILVNFIWKNFILKAFDFKIVGKSIIDFLPKKLCKAGNIEAPDLILLGGKIPDLFTQKPPSPSDVAPEVEK